MSRTPEHLTNLPRPRCIHLTQTMKCRCWPTLPDAAACWVNLADQPYRLVLYTGRSKNRVINVVFIIMDVRTVWPVNCVLFARGN